jgi:hypothetical protein
MQQPHHLSSLLSSPPLIQLPPGFAFTSESDEKTGEEIMKLKDDLKFNDGDPVLTEEFLNLVQSQN